MPDAIDVPMLDLRAEYEPIRDEILAAVDGVLSSQRFILGPEVEGLEAEIAERVGAPFAIGCASGSDALLLALMAHEVGPGDEVVCPSYTFFATAGAISRLGARPVFADIDRVTYNATPETLAAACARTSRLKAILPVHLFGAAADLDGITALAFERGVAVIEDAAQAIGSVDASGAPVGSRPQLGCFSFFPSKNLGGYGDGGMITAHDPERAERLRGLRQHGAKVRYEHQEVGFNSRLDALQAAVLRVKLRHLPAAERARRENALHYEELFCQAGGADSSVPLGEGGLPVRFPARPAEPAHHVFNQYVIRVPAERRDPLRDFLAERGIGTAIYYPVPLHLQPCFADLGHQAGDLPECERAALETLAVPVHPALSKSQREAVVGAVVEFLTS